MDNIILDEELLLEGIWDNMKDKFGNDKVAKFRQLKDGNQLPSGGDLEQKKNPQYWNDKTQAEFDEYLTGVIEGNFYTDRQKEDLTSKLRNKLAHDIDVSAANELARSFWEHRNEIPDQEQRNIKYWIQNPDVHYNDLAMVLQPIQFRKAQTTPIYDTVYESEFMIIYRVYNWIAARNLSKGTSWCITGRYSSESGDGSSFFQNYLPDNPNHKYYYIVHDLTHRITYRYDNRIRRHSANTPQQYCLVVNASGQITQVWEPSDTQIKKIPWIIEEHQVQPIPGVTLPYGNEYDWREPERIDLHENPDNHTAASDIGTAAAEPFILEDDGTTLHSCNITTGTVYIPSSVTRIGQYAFGSRHRDVTQIIIPNSVTSIGNTAFAYSGIQSITIPNSITEIPYFCFGGCRNLTSITLPEGLTSIGVRAFEDTPLESVVIPNTVTAIEHHAFNHCRSIQKLVLPEGLTTFDGSVVCKAHIKKLILPTTLTTLSNRYYLESRNIKIVPKSLAMLQTLHSIGANITAENDDADFLIIENHVVGLISKRKSRLVVPDGVTAIGANFLSGLSGVRTGQTKEVILPNSVTTIYPGAFAG